MVKERPDLMRPDICSVWLEVGYKHQKKILLCNVYREWQELGADNTGNITEQLLRWTKFLDIWEIALASGLETICTGDININHCNWKDQNIPRSNQTYKLRSLIQLLFNRIFPYGVTQLVSGPTRYFPG